MLNSIFSDYSSSIEISSLLICVVCSLFLGLLIAFTYKYTSKYTKSFLLTLTMLPLLVQAVIIMVNGNLGTSVAVLGAFSLVKFRSVPGTSKEILFVFFAMTIGLALGMGHVFFATIVALIGCAVILLVSRLTIFDIDKKERILRIYMPEDLDYTNVFDDIFKKYTTYYELVKTKIINMGSLYDLRYRVRLKPNINEKKFIDDLRVKNGNLKITLSQVIEDNEF